MHTCCNDCPLYKILILCFMMAKIVFASRFVHCAYDFGIKTVKFQNNSHQVTIKNFVPSLFKDPKINKILFISLLNINSIIFASTFVHFTYNLENKNHIISLMNINSRSLAKINECFARVGS